MFVSDTKMACEFIDRFQCFEPSTTHPEAQGILDIHCGCMVSKWTAIEFKKIFSLEDDFLQVNIIYMEPFCAFDSFTLHLSWSKVPHNVMKAYEIAKAQTTFDVQDDMVSMIVPYLYKNKKTMMKRFKPSSYESGDLEVLEGVYITSKKDLNKINMIFNM